MKRAAAQLAHKKDSTDKQHPKNNKTQKQTNKLTQLTTNNPINTTKTNKKQNYYNKKMPHYICNTHENAFIPFIFN